MAGSCINYDVQADWKMNRKAITLGQVEDETRVAAVYIHSFT
jgi:hypothetical protein